ncbi:MAG: CYCXC family (seleno)protein [Blastocatellales bacterium]
MRGKRIAFMSVAALLCVMPLISACNTNGSQNTAHNHQGQQTGASPTATVPARRIPAHFKTAPDPKTLPPTLAPEQFTGETREAYQVAKEIPVTLAQLPCFCYCDAIGHKSLHSCYEDDHSAGCGICKVSALMASKLKKEGLSDEQVRDRLIAHYQ